MLRGMPLRGFTTDPLEGTQFLIEELRAACEVAETAILHAMAHTYSPRAVTCRC